MMPEMDRLKDVSIVERVLMLVSSSFSLEKRFRL